MISGWPHDMTRTALGLCAQRPTYICNWEKPLKSKHEIMKVVLDKAQPWYNFALTQIADDESWLYWVDFENASSAYFDWPVTAHILVEKKHMYVPM
jgi:hypothetical protein